MRTIYVYIINYIIHGLGFNVPNISKRWLQNPTAHYALLLPGSLAHLPSHFRGHPGSTYKRTLFCCHRRPLQAALCTACWCLDPSLVDKQLISVLTLVFCI